MTMFHVKHRVGNTVKVRQLPTIDQRIIRCPCETKNRISKYRHPENTRDHNSLEGWSPPRVEIVKENLIVGERNDASTEHSLPRENQWVVLELSLMDLTRLVSLFASLCASRTCAPPVWLRDELHGRHCVTPRMGKGNELG